jgi:hypothetical protein
LNPGYSRRVVAILAGGVLLLTYGRIANALLDGTIDLADPDDVKQLTDYLIDEWIGDYRRFVTSSDVVEVRLHRFSYLFDVKMERLISAWGLSPGATDHVRDKKRMRGHPLGGDERYHRGHAIPNQMGGGTDINLVAQKGKINIGPFRLLEKRAVASPGSLYFSYWLYPGSQTQRPNHVQQGLIVPGSLAIELADFAN